MAQAITVGSMKSVRTSATNLNLNVTSEEEFKALVDGFNTGFHKTANGFSDQLKTLNGKKREAVYKDLGAAYAVCEVLMRPENAEWLETALDERDIPIVEDPKTRNEYVPLLRLLMGYWPKATKGNQDPPFTWPRSIERYAAVLRGAKQRGVAIRELEATLIAEKGFKKFLKANQKLLSNDVDVKEIDRRFKLVVNQPAKARVPVKAIDLPEKAGDRPELVALYCYVVGDELRVLGRLPTSAQSIRSYIDKVSEALAKDIELQQQRERAEKAEAELALLKANPELVAA